MELEEIKKLTAQGEGEYFEDLEKGIRPAFGSPGGKRYLAKTIVSYIPEHKTYVEPFIGGGAVFFAKEPSEVEVINDLDKDIAFAYRFIKNITDEQFKALKSKNWKASKTLFDKLKNLKTDEPLEKFRKIVYLKKLSYGESGKNYDQTNEGRDLTNGLDSLLRIKERLKDVKIENNDYRKSVNYDSKETFYYLDPPYPETNNVGNIDLADLHKFCKNLKGKFILSLNDKSKNMNIFRDFNIKKVRVSQQMLTGGSQMQMRTELLISNFPLKKENIYLAKSDEVLIEDLPSFVWIPEFINPAGSLFYEREGDRKPNDIDIIVRAKEEEGKFTITLDKSLRLKIDRVLEKRVKKISGKWLTPEWLGSTFGPNWKYQTGWDLVLVPHQPQEIREMNEPEFAEEFYKEEGYEEFCDFGSGHFSKFVNEHPEFNIEEFREYVIVHNKADWDSGELEDITAPEILRLAKEFAQEKNIHIKKKHSREKCMECDEPPVYECLWAEGMGHAWFCKGHFKEWATTGDGKGEIISVKEVKDGIAAEKFGDNRNPNIWAKLKVEFAKDFYKKLSDRQREEYDKETAIINENKKKPQAEEVHEFKGAKWTFPNGHPRCLICGDEEPVGGVCNMTDSWYQKHRYDDEEAWEKERKILREKGILKKVANWVNSPTFAYQAIYGKLPDIPLRGRTDSPKKQYKLPDGSTIEVDKEFRDTWLKDLNNISDIEIRATDIGHSAERIAFVVFRMKDPKEDCKVKAISDELNKIERLYSKYDTGREGRLRIVVAGKIKLGDKNWEEWWNSLAGKIKEVVKEKLEKLDLEQFRAEGIDDDLKNPAIRHKELFADLRYIGNSGYPKLKEDKKWGKWKLEDALKYYAAIVDTLRSVYFPVMSPKIGDKGYKTSYWECYREARKYMKSKPPTADKVKEWDAKRKEIIKSEQEEIAKFTFKKISEAEHIVGGIVYFSYKTDSQKDWTTPPEVWKALKRFMLKKKKLKVMHEGKEREIPIIENYFVEEQHHKGGTSPNNLLEKGDWWIAVYLGDKENKDIWERVLKKELTGFSMAGRASSPS